jgi:hypothetical protein
MSSCTQILTHGKLRTEFMRGRLRRAERVIDDVLAALAAGTAQSPLTE